MQCRRAPGSMPAMHLLAIVSMAVAVFGCTGSVHAIVPDSALCFEPHLLGTWAHSASREKKRGGHPKRPAKLRYLVH